MNTGTIVSIVINCILAVIGVLQSVDWVHIVGSQKAGLVLLVISVVNGALHAFTGSDSLLAPKQANH